MNIHEPSTSRTLATMIQNIAAESRGQFISDAKRAQNMESFMKGLNRYKTDLSSEFSTKS